MKCIHLNLWRMNADPKVINFYEWLTVDWCMPTVYSVAHTDCFSVSGVWEPLLAITQQCGLTIEPFFGGVVITAPYTGPCVELEVILNVILWS